MKPPPPSLPVMLRFMSSVASRHHAFTATELDAAEAMLPPGWALDRAACACAPATADRGWEAVLALAGPEGRTMKCSSSLQPSAGDARGDALISVSDAVQMIAAMARREGASRQTALIVDRPEKPTLRPSQIVSLRGANGPGADRR